LILKAVAGGGGRGHERVGQQEEILATTAGTAAARRNGLRHSDVYAERFIEIRGYEFRCWAISTGQNYSILRTGMIRFQRRHQN